MGVVSRRWMWVEYIGVASGCGCKEVYRFLYIYYQEHMSTTKWRWSLLLLNSHITTEFTHMISYR